jgi:hypothetical protein
MENEARIKGEPNEVMEGRRKKEIRLQEKQRKGGRIEKETKK